MVRTLRLVSDESEGFVARLVLPLRAWMIEDEAAGGCSGFCEVVELGDGLLLLWLWTDFKSERAERA